MTKRIKLSKLKENHIAVFLTFVVIGLLILLKNQEDQIKIKNSPKEVATFLTDGNTINSFNKIY